MDVRSLSLALHVLGGVTGLILGIWSLKPPTAGDGRSLIRGGYVAAIVTLVTFLYGLLVVDWPRFEAAQQVAFGALAVLAAVIVARVWLGFRALRDASAGSSERYMDHLYFGYISLWEGFFIVGLIDLGAPGWLVAAIGVGLLIVGGRLFGNYKRGVLAEAPRPARAS